MVMLGQIFLSFEDIDVDSWLVVERSRVSLRILCWDGGISRDDVGLYSSFSLDSHRDWNNI